VPITHQVRLVRLVEALTPRRYLVLAIAAALFWGGELYICHGYGGDWEGFRHASRMFTTAPAGGDVVTPLTLTLVYPFTFLSVRTGWVLCSFLCMALGVGAARHVEHSAEIIGFGSRRDRERAVLLGGPAFLWAWSLPGARIGHLCDVLALVFIALAIRAVVRGSWLGVSLAVAVAINCQPWALLLLPLVVTNAGARWRSLFVVGALTIVPWIPFWFVQHGHLGSASLPVAPDSAIRYLGSQVGNTPGWPRLVQIVVALPLAGYAIVRRRWYLVPVIVLTARYALDPQTYTYYAAGAILGMFMWDVILPLKVPGARTTIVCFVLALFPEDLKVLHSYPQGAIVLVIILRFAAIVAPLLAIRGAPPHRVMPDVAARTGPTGNQAIAPSAAGRF
jgi:hypothetical protein